jgi:hypothetical protein
LEEKGGARAAGPLSLTIDDTQRGGIPGDPGDVISQRLPLNNTVPCLGGSVDGQVSLSPFQNIHYSVTGDSSGAQIASIALTEPGRPFPPRVLTAVIDVTAGGTPYPAFPGIPRNKACRCDPVTGRHKGSTCPLVGAPAAVVGGPRR